MTMVVSQIVIVNTTSSDRCCPGRCTMLSKGRHREERTHKGNGSLRQRRERTPNDSESLQNSFLEEMTVSATNAMGRPVHAEVQLRCRSIGGARCIEDVARQLAPLVSSVIPFSVSLTPCCRAEMSRHSHCDESNDDTKRHILIEIIGSKQRSSVHTMATNSQACRMITKDMWYNTISKRIPENAFTKKCYRKTAWRVKAI